MTEEINENDIIEQLLQFNVGSTEEIKNAINKVVNKKDINEITEFIMNNKKKEMIDVNVNYMFLIVYQYPPHTLYTKRTLLTYLQKI